MDFINVGKCALHNPWKTRSVQLKPNQFTPVIQTALPLASTILFLSTCSQSEPVATLDATELELLLTEELVATEELLLILDDELVIRELELVCTTLEELDFTELDELVTVELDELEGFELEMTTELDELDLIELDELVITPSQIVPVTEGFSAVVPPFVP